MRWKTGKECTSWTYIDDRLHKSHVGEKVARLSETRRVEFETSSVEPREIQVEDKRESPSSQ